MGQEVTSQRAPRDPVRSPEQKWLADVMLFVFEMRFFGVRCTCQNSIWCSNE